MKKWTFAALTILFVTKSAFAIASSTDYNHVPKDQIVNPQAIEAWEEKMGYVTLKMDLNKVQKIGLDCKDKNLYPTHADQGSKQYHIFDYASYNRLQLNPNDEACLLSSKYKNGAGKFYCMKADLLYTAVISDTYKDSCGHYYRGYWRVTYLQKNDNMGTLFSKGRSMYQNPNSEFPGDMLMDGTYKVDVNQFLFLSPLFKSDMKYIKEAFVRNQTSRLKYNSKTLLFEEVHTSKKLK